MARLVVALSKVKNGNMYIPGDTRNEVVIENRRQWLRGISVDINSATRLDLTYDHSDFCRYFSVTNANKGQGMQGGSGIPADALIATQPGHALFLPVADCVATVFFDEVHSVFMLSHLGRHSLEQEGGVRSVEYLVEHFGVNPATLKVWLGPAPSKELYPIYALNNKGMKEAVHEQLAKAGINAEHITDNVADTVASPEYYSHSAFLSGKKPEDGRFAMVAMMVEDE